MVVGESEVQENDDLTFTGKPFLRYRFKHIFTLSEYVTQKVQKKDDDKKQRQINHYP